MNYDYRFLSEDRISEIFATFLKAFSDYAVDVSYMNEKNMLTRAIKNGVDFESSVGVYADGSMVGFTLVGVERWKGILAAFDIYTGIIKPYRGKGIAGKMFNFITPRLKEKGVEKFFLEVLQENEPAVRAYKKTGFVLTRELVCFELDTNTFNNSIKPSLPIKIKPVSQENISEYDQWLDWEPSWENSLSSIGRIPDEVVLFGAKADNEEIGIIVYYPALNWIMCLAVERSFRGKGIGTALLRHLLNSGYIKDNKVKLLNVEQSDSLMLEYLQHRGFEMYTSQYEMEYELK